MTLQALLDSVIVIDYLNGERGAKAFLNAAPPAEWAVSLVTYAEVLVGIPAEGTAYTRTFLDAFSLLSINRDVATLAAQLRRTHRWKLPDAFQAALAQHHGIPLATRNTKDFDPARHPFVTVPYVLRPA